MKVKTITYQRVKNLGNYESERMEMMAELDDDDDVLMASEALMDMVRCQLGVQHSYHEDEKGKKYFPSKASDIKSTIFSKEEIEDIPW